MCNKELEQLDNKNLAYYETIERPFKHKFVALVINESYEEEGRTIYDSVRRSWCINIEEAKKAEFVLAEYKGIVVGIFRPIEWYRPEYNKKRWNFDGEKVTDKSITDLYLNKKLPISAKGPIRYSWNIESKNK